MTLLSTIKKERERIYGINKDVVIMKYHFIVNGKREGFYVNNYAGETEKSVGKRIKKTYGNDADYEFVNESEKWETENIPYEDAKKVSKQFILMTS